MLIIQDLKINTYSLIFIESFLVGQWSLFSKGKSEYCRLLISILPILVILSFLGFPTNFQEILNVNYTKFEK